MDERKIKTIQKFLAQNTNFDSVEEGQKILKELLMDFDIDPDIRNPLIKNIDAVRDLPPEAAMAALQRGIVVANLINSPYVSVVKFIDKEMSKSGFVNEVLKGGHLAIHDDGAMAEALKGMDVVMAQNRAVHSHYSQTRKNTRTQGMSFQAKGIFSEVLFGEGEHRDKDDKGPGTVSWIQLEGAPFNPLEDPIGAALHGLHYIEHKLTGQNIGQYGKSYSTEKSQDPSKVMEAYESKSVGRYRESEAAKSDREHRQALNLPSPTLEGNFQLANLLLRVFNKNPARKKWQQWEKAKFGRGEKVDTPSFFRMYKVLVYKKGLKEHIDVLSLRNQGIERDIREFSDSLLAQLNSERFKKLPDSTKKTLRTDYDRIKLKLDECVEMGLSLALFEQEVNHLKDKNRLTLNDIEVVSDKLEYVEQELNALAKTSSRINAHDKPLREEFEKSKVQLSEIIAAPAHLPEPPTATPRTINHTKRNKTASRR